MKVIFVDPFLEEIQLELNINETKIPFNLKTESLQSMLPKVDIISLHIPFTGKPVLGKIEFDQMKNGTILVNASRGGTVDEDALLTALNSNKIAAAGIDVFVNEPNPRQDLLKHPNVSCTPHIGASTEEAQEKIGIELAEQLINRLS